MSERFCNGESNHGSLIPHPMEKPSIKSRCLSGLVA